MSDKISKITKILSYILFAISILFGVLFYNGAITAEPVPEHIVVALEKTMFTMDQMGSSLDNFVYVVYLLFGIAAISTLVFSFLNIFKNAKTAKRSLLSIVLIAIVIFAAYMFASSEIPTFFGSEKFNITEGTSRIVGTGLFSMYLLFIIAVIGILYTEVRGAFK